MSTLLRPLHRLRTFVRLVLASVVLAGVASAADAARSFNVPAGDAAQTLKAFASQAGREIVFAPATVQGVTTNAVNGDLAPTEALARMLRNTGLAASQDTKTGAFAVRRNSEPAEKNVASRPAEAPAGRAKVEDGVIELEEVAVTGTRLRPNTGEQPIQPVLTFSSLDIERTGAANLGQLLQYIPAVTSFTTGLGTETVTSTIASGLAGGQSFSRTSAQLRGGSQTETLLLVDGKRVPLTGLRNAGGNGYDLGGIPMSAIDRVEVLLDGASAIYGADAINGVINVILKKRYSGTEVRFNYDNTFDGDAGVKTASLTHGFNRGKFSGLVTVSASSNNVMLLTDRYLTESYDRTRYGGITNQSQPTLFVEGTGSLSVASGNLPGTTTPRVSIPANFSGGSIAVADYLAAPAPVGGITPGRQSATSYARDRSAYTRLAYEFNDRLTLTASARIGRKEYRDNGQWRRVENVTIPAGYPGNPFTGPVRLSKIFYDLPLIVTGSDTSNDEFSVKVDGKLPGDWRYEAGINYVRGRNDMFTPDLPGAGGQIGGTVAPASLFTSRLNSEIAAGRRPLLIYDSRTQAPNAPGALDVFWVSQTQTRLKDLVQTWTYSAEANGTVFTLPAGDIRAVIGTEMREEYVDFPGSLGGQVWTVIPQRDVLSVFAEARIPIFSQKRNVPLARQLDVNLAVRTEDYSDFGRTTTPRYGVAWRPVRQVLFRGSYGEGFLAPQLYRVAQEVSSISLFTFQQLYPGATDLSRGNAPLVGTVTTTSGGNPNLKPQLSENLTFGVVLDVPKVKGLSLSFDYYDNDYTDAFGSISSIMDRQRLAPETLTRGPRLPSDPADWPGPIIGVDLRTINIAESRTSGYSFGVRYTRATRLGDFSINSAGEKTLRREERQVVGAPLTATVNKRYVPLRITTSIFWNRGPWDAGVTNVYGGEAWADTNNATIAPSRYTDDVMRWDLNVAHDFGRRADFRASSGPWWRRGLSDTKLRVTIINLLDEEPPLNVNGAFTSSVIDPRLRRYVIDVSKKF